MHVSQGVFVLPVLKWVVKCKDREDLVDAGK